MLALRRPITHITAMVAPPDVPRDAACPICGKRCRDVDLNRWLSGVYAVPIKEEEDEDGVPKADEQP